MKKKDKKQMTTREVWSVTLRGFRLLYRMQPKALLTDVILAIWNALTPYVGISFSAQIIDELAGERNPERLWSLVLLTLGSAAIISLIGALLSRLNNAESKKVWSSYEHLFVAKNLDMDFVRVDDPETHKLLSTVQQNLGGGWGLMRIRWSLNSVISPIFSILGGIALTVTLVTSRVPESAGRWTILNDPLFFVMIIAVMVAVSCVSSLIRNKAGTYYAASSGDHNLANRLFSWFGFVGQKKSDAANMRMYRIDRICLTHSLNKHGLFGSRGYFAELNRGKVGVLNMVSGTVSHIFTLIVYLYVCLKAWAGAFGVGGVTQYISAVSNIAGSVGSFLSIWGDIRNNAPFVKLFFEYMDLPNVMYQGSLTTEKRSDNKYAVEFRNVSFKYPGTDVWALRNVSMKFKNGQRLAVVGKNGSGKTTFIKLLCRLYDPTEGEILLNGIDIRKYDYHDYMGIFSVVFQDFKLFPYTIGQNVASARQYDANRVKDCLVKAGFGERLAEMEAGTETYLYKDRSDDGINISGGEAQKIAIARALYKESPFIILDEPTAALDPIAEAEIYSKFNDIVGDRTAIYISHRLSSCRFCDEIVVFDEGAVIQHGTHEALVADTGGRYYELWNAQAQYYTK